MSTELTPAQLATAASHLTAAKMYSLASCVMLFYDIAITFGDEVERIWKQRFTGATVLWFMNRYLSPLGYIVIIVSFHDPSWSKATCQRYVLYPEILKIFTATAVGLIFILRLYSIYSKSKPVLYTFSTLLVVELAIKIWAFTDGVMLQLPPGLVGCILTGKSAPGDRIIYTWVAELVFDSAVFFATLYRTLQLYRRTIIGEALSLITVIMRDGIMYFAAIFVSNLVTVLIFVLAPPDLKVINASFSTLITSLMVSRLMLNLRGEVMRRGPVMSTSHSSGHGDNESYALSSTSFTKRPNPSNRTPTMTGWSAFETSIVGNLGAPIITFEQDNRDYYSDYEEEEVVDPTFPSTPRSETAPPSPLSPTSHSRTPTSQSAPSSPHSVYPPQKAAHRGGNGRESEETTSHTVSGMSTHSDATIPRHADYIVQRIRGVGVSRQPSTDSSPTYTAVSPTRATSGTGMPSNGVPVRIPPMKNQNQGPYRKQSTRRPRTSESSDRSSQTQSQHRERTRDRARGRERDLTEMMQTRSLPSPLVVQVTEEVVVDEVEAEAGEVGSPASSSPGSASALQTRSRRPWLAPPSWRLSRDERSEGRRGSSEG